MSPSPIPRADVVSPGHGLKRRCDNCRGYTTETAGSSYFRKVLWHCPKCTTARKAATASAATTEPTA